MVRDDDDSWEVLYVFVRLWTGFTEILWAIRDYWKKMKKMFVFDHFYFNFSEKSFWNMYITLVKFINI
jgi:hypothetical protein